MGNTGYYSLEKFVSSRLHSTKLEVNTYKTIILPVASYDCANLVSRLERGE